MQDCGSQGTSREEHPQVAQCSGPMHLMCFCLSEELQTLGVSFFAVGGQAMLGSTRKDNFSVMINGRPPNAWD